MPADTNSAGDVCGRWITSLMDIAGGIAARTSSERVVTVSVTDMPFLRPVHDGDVVCGYTESARVGTTSVTSHVEISALRGGHPPRTKVTSAGFK